jgi:hypothetical protein
LLQVLGLCDDVTFHVGEDIVWLLELSDIWGDVTAFVVPEASLDVFA